MLWDRVRFFVRVNVQVMVRVSVSVRVCVKVCVRGLTLKGSKSRIVPFCHYLPVPGVGKFRACCFSWM